MLGWGGSRTEKGRGFSPWRWRGDSRGSGWKSKWEGRESEESKGHTFAKFLLELWGRGVERRRDEGIWGENFSLGGCLC